MPALPYWFWPGDDRPTEEIDDEIAEELRLHLDLLAEQQMRDGVAPDVAKRRAAERFGDVPTLARHCRAIQQGDAPMLKRIQAALTLLLLLAVVWLGVRDYVAASTTTQHMNQTTAFLRTIQADLVDLRQGLSPSEGAPTYEATHPVAKRVATKSDLTGAVIDSDGAPVAGAEVLLIVKTWPNNRFRQDDYAVKTDSTGAFVLKGRIPLDGQYGINAAVVAEGKALASQYVLVEDPAGEPPEPLSFQLVESKPVAVKVTDADGKPLAKALVAPSARITENDAEHLVYHQSSRPAWKKTNADGVVTVDWFADGDLGKITIRPRGGEWQERKLNATTDGDVTITIDN